MGCSGQSQRAQSESPMFGGPQVLARPVRNALIRLTTSLSSLEPAGLCFGLGFRVQGLEV